MEILFAEVVKVLNHFAEKTCSEDEGKVPRSYQQISELEAMLHMEKIEYAVTLLLSIMPVLFFYTNTMHAQLYA